MCLCVCGGVGGHGQGSLYSVASGIIRRMAHARFPVRPAMSSCYRSLRVPEMGVEMGRRMRGYTDASLRMWPGRAGSHIDFSRRQKSTGELHLVLGFFGDLL